MARASSRGELGLRIKWVKRRGRVVPTRGWFLGVEPFFGDPPLFVREGSLLRALLLVEQYLSNCATSHKYIAWSIWLSSNSLMLVPLASPRRRLRRLPAPHALSAIPRRPPVLDRDQG